MDPEASSVDVIFQLLVRLAILADDRAAVQDQTAADPIVPEEEALVNIGVQRDVAVLPEEVFGHGLAECAAGQLVLCYAADHAVRGGCQRDLRFRRVTVDRNETPEGLADNQYVLDGHNVKIEVLNKAGGIIIAVDTDEAYDEADAVFAVPVGTKEVVEIRIIEDGAVGRALVQPAAQAKGIDVKVAAAAPAGFEGGEVQQFAAGSVLQCDDHVLAEGGLGEVDIGVLHGDAPFMVDK